MQHAIKKPIKYSFKKKNKNFPSFMYHSVNKCRTSFFEIFALV